MINGQELPSEPFQCCAKCDALVPERSLLDHMETCVAKPAPAVRYFQYAVEGHPIEGRRFVEEVPPPRHEMEGASCYECGGIGGHSSMCIRGRELAKRASQKPEWAPCSLCANPPDCKLTGCLDGRALPIERPDIVARTDRDGVFALSYRPIEKPAPAALADTIAARSARYGDFKKQAEIGEAMRSAMRTAPNWERLNPYMRLALEWITDKISRLLCGDPNYRDNWHDIAGYASLVDRELAA